MPDARLAVVSVYFTTYGFDALKDCLSRIEQPDFELVTWQVITGSVDLDASLAGTIPNANRWDYGIGYREADRQECAIWVEVHPATAGEVDAVLRKHGWLRNWLRTQARDLTALTNRRVNGKAFLWLATQAGVHIRQGSQQAFRLQAAGFDLPRQKIVLS